MVAVEMGLIKFIDINPSEIVFDTHDADIETLIIIPIDHYFELQQPLGFDQDGINTDSTPPRAMMHVTITKM